MSGAAAGLPKARNGNVEAIRVLMVARRSAIDERIAFLALRPLRRPRSVRRAGARRPPRVERSSTSRAPDARRWPRCSRPSWPATTGYSAFAPVRDGDAPGADRRRVVAAGKPPPHGVHAAPPDRQQAEVPGG